MEKLSDRLKRELHIVCETIADIYERGGKVSNDLHKDATKYLIRILNMLNVLEGNKHESL